MHLETDESSRMEVSITDELDAGLSLVGEIGASMGDRITTGTSDGLIMSFGLFWVGNTVDGGVSNSCLIASEIDLSSLLHSLLESIDKSVGRE